MWCVGFGNCSSVCAFHFTLGECHYEGPDWNNTVFISPNYWCGSTLSLRGQGVVVSISHVISPLYKCFAAYLPHMDMYVYRPTEPENTCWIFPKNMMRVKEQPFYFLCAKQKIFLLLLHAISTGRKFVYFYTYKIQNIPK